MIERGFRSGSNIAKRIVQVKAQKNLTEGKSNENRISFW